MGVLCWTALPYTVYSTYIILRVVLVFLKVFWAGEKALNVRAEAAVIT